MFKNYKKTQIAELRPVTQEEIELGRLIITKTPNRNSISVSQTNLVNGSPKQGDMIARNLKNHNDQWLVAEQYFKDNFTDMEKPFIEAEIRDLLKQVDKGEISFSRFVEILNEKASKQ